jgi:hypothetical protein
MFKKEVSKGNTRKFLLTDALYSGKIGSRWGKGRKIYKKKQGTRKRRSVHLTIDAAAARKGQEEEFVSQTFYINSFN